MTIVTVTKTTFDYLENEIGDALRVEREAVFAGDKDGQTAFGRAGEFILNLPPAGLYLAWDGNVYPKYKIELVEAQ